MHHYGRQGNDSSGWATLLTAGHVPDRQRQAPSAAPSPTLSVGRPVRRVPRRVSVLTELPVRHGRPAAGRDDKVSAAGQEAATGRRSVGVGWRSPFVLVLPLPRRRAEPDPPEIRLPVQQRVVVGELPPFVPPLDLADDLLGLPLQQPQAVAVARPLDRIDSNTARKTVRNPFMRRHSKYRRSPLQNANAAVSQ